MRENFGDKVLKRMMDNVELGSNKIAQMYPKNTRPFDSKEIPKEDQLLSLIHI